MISFNFFVTFSLNNGLVNEFTEHTKENRLINSIFLTLTKPKPL